MKLWRWLVEVTTGSSKPLIGWIDSRTGRVWFFKMRSGHYGRTRRP